MLVKVQNTVLLFWKWQLLWPEQARYLPSMGLHMGVWGIADRCCREVEMMIVPGAVVSGRGVQDVAVEKLFTGKAVG